MKVFLFSTGFIEFLIQQSNALSKLVTTILMLPKNRMNNIHFQLISKDVIFEPFNLPRLRNPANILMMRTIVNTIKRHKPDILHIQENGHPWFFLAFPFLKKNPIIDTFHDPKPHLGENTLRFQLKIRSSLKHSTQFIVHGNKLKKDMIEYYDISEDLIHVIPLGNLSIIKNWQTMVFNENPNTVLFFGRISKYKGLEYLIQAETLISKEIPDVKIIIAGKRDKFNKYEKMIINKDRFIIKNYIISNEEISELFQKASLIVLPYLEATQSGIIPLAYVFGKPVVVTNVGALSDVVENGKTGFIVPPKNPKALADAVIKLLRYDKLRKEMGKNAYNFAMTELSWDRIAEMTIEVYKKAIRDFEEKK